MKLITYLMAILILLLSCMPCQDVAASNTASAHHSTAISKENKEPATHDDNCSPFCHCTCCAASSIHQFPAHFHFIAFGLNQIFGNFISSRIIGIALPVWQPPQLA